MMNLAQRKAWEVYTASKQAQCANMPQVKDGWKWNELLAMFLISVIFLALLINLICLPFLMIIVRSW